MDILKELDLSHVVGGGYWWFLNGMKDIAYYECQKAPDSDAGLR